MKVYKCEKCNKNYIRYQSLWVHTKRIHTEAQNNKVSKSSNDVLKSSNDVLKSSNDVLKSSNDVLKSSNDVLKSSTEKIKTENKLECNYCKKILSTSSSRIRHEKRCKELYPNIVIVKKNNYKCEICNMEFKCEKSIYRHRKKCKETQIIQTNNNTINNNTINNNTINNNTINNNTINNNTINNNITINILGKETFKNISMEKIKRFAARNPSKTAIVEFIYFNKENPENHMFCNTNLNSKMLKCYNPIDNTIKVCNKKSYLDKLITRLIETIVILEVSIKEELDIESIEKICSIVTKAIEFRGKERITFIEEIEILAYNKRQNILNTWKKNNIN